MDLYGLKNENLDTDLRVEHTDLTVLGQQAHTTTQLTLDDDYNVPEYKADIVAIIDVSGHVKLDEVSAEDGLVKLRGQLQFEVLYKSPKEDGLFQSLRGELPFHEAIRMEQAMNDSLVQVTMDIEDLTVSSINSRKLQIRSLLTAQIDLKTMHTYALPSELETDAGIQTKITPLHALTVDSHKKDTLRIREDVALTSNKPEIGEILSYTLNLRGMDCQLLEGSIRVSGELFLHMLYRTETGNGTLQCLETSVPVRGELEAPEAQPDLIAWITTKLLSAEVEAKEDADGELRQVHVAALIELDEWLWEEKQFDLIEDIYSIKDCAQGVTKQVVLPHFLVKNDSRFRLNERIEIQTKKPVIQLCGCEGTIQIEHTTETEEGILTEGIVNLHLLLIVADDEQPLVSHNVTLPFSQIVEIPAVQPQAALMYEMDGGIDQLNATLLDGNMAECKAGIRLSVIAFENQPYTYVESMEPVADEKNNHQAPGIIGIYVQPGENLWSIAKKYMLPQEEIRRWNPQIEEDVKPEDKLLIIRQLS